MKEIVKKYIIKILFLIMTIIIIALGILYSNKTTEKVEKENKIIVEQEPIKEEKKKYKVDIKGEVENPGVYELEEDSRVIDVIKMSGGLTKYASTDYINLSKLIKDEMVVIIYSKQEIEDYNKNLNEKKEIIKYQIIEKECVCPNTINDACISENNELSSNENDFKEEIENNNSNEKNNNDNKLLNINEATLEELQTINGVGESKAKAIIEYRKENKFEKIEDIKNVSGVGDSLFEKIKDYITV